MAGGQQTTSEAVIEGARGLALDAVAALTRDLAGAPRSVAIELAEAVETLGRAVDHLQLLVARAVDEAAPAPRASSVLVDHAGQGLETSSDSARASDSAGAGDCAAAESRAPFRSGRDLLRTRLRISGAEAGRRISLARHVLPRTTLGGEPLAPRLEHVGRVIDDVSGDAARHILRASTRITVVAGPEAAAEFEESLTTHALTFDPDTLGRLADRTIILFDPDGPAPDETDHCRGVFVGTTRNGLTTIKLIVDALQREILTTVFDTATNPRRAESADAGSTSSDDSGSDDSGSDDSGSDDTSAAGTSSVGPVSASTTVPDEADRPAIQADDRSRASRMLDALMSACGAALRSGDLPRTAGAPTQVVVTMQLADLLGGLARVGLGERITHLGAVEATGSDAVTVLGTADPPGTGGPSVPGGPPGSGGVAHLPHAGPVPLRLVRRLACDADLIPVVLGTTGRILDVGRTNRLFPAWMRRALIARDKGCTYPGCTIPATWCEAHHILGWADGGDTSTDNAVLVCSSHHHLLHQGGWKVHLEGDRARFAPPWSALPGLTSNPYHSGSAA